MLSIVTGQVVVSGWALISGLQLQMLQAPTGTQRKSRVLLLGVSQRNWVLRYSDAHAYSKKRCTQSRPNCMNSREQEPNEFAKI